MAFTSPVAGVQTSGATFAQLQAGGLSAIVEKLITVNGGGTAAPTSACTLSESGSGGTLPAGTYYVVATETNGFGETTAGPPSTGQAITLGQNLVITPPTLKSGNVARNYYVGTSSTGPFTRAVTGSTGSTATISAPLPSNSYAENPPTFNTTAFEYQDAAGNTINFTQQYVMAALRGNLQRVYNGGGKSIDNFLHADPIPFHSQIEKIRHYAAAFALISQAFSDIGALIDANAGTIRIVGLPAVDEVGSGVSDYTGIGQVHPGRTWP